MQQPHALLHMAPPPRAPRLLLRFPRLGSFPPYPTSSFLGAEAGGGSQAAFCAVDGVVLGAELLVGWLGVRDAALFRLPATVALTNFT